MFIFFTTFQHYLSMLQTVQLIYLPDTVFQWMTLALRTWKLYFFLIKYWGPKGLILPSGLRAESKVVWGHLCGKKKAVLAASPLSCLCPQPCCNAAGVTRDAAEGVKVWPSQTLWFPSWQWEITSCVPNAKEWLNWKNWIFFFFSIFFFSSF